MKKGHTFWWKLAMILGLSGSPVPWKPNRPEAKQQPVQHRRRFALGEQHTRPESNEGPAEVDVKDMAVGQKMTKTCGPLVV